METKDCFELDCRLEVEYSCRCTSPNTYSCEYHFGKHLKLPNRTHVFDSLFEESCEGTKEAVLGFLVKEKLKNNKLKHKIAGSFSQQLLNSENVLKDLIKNLDSSSDEISNCFDKISKSSKLLKSEQDPVLRLLSLQPNEAIEKIKAIISNNSDSYNNATDFFGFNRKIEKMIEYFIKEKFEAYLDNRFFEIENILEEHNKAIGLVSNELSCSMNSISEIINKNEREIEEIKIKNEKILDLLNNKNASIIQDFNWKLKSSKTELRNRIQDLEELIKIRIESKSDLVNNQIESITEEFNSELNSSKLQFQNNILSLEELRNKTIKILSKPNDPELEMDFKQTCSIYESNPSIYNSQTIKVYHEYLNNYHHQSSIYRIDTENGNTKLYIYNTENEIEVSKILNTPEKLSSCTCITQLPDGKLFCFGNDPPSRATLIIESNLNVQILPSGTRCSNSSAIYFNKNVYCFGGYKNKRLTLSKRFDLKGNRWIKLAPMPQADSPCNSVIFNGHILISGYLNRSIWSYWIDSDSFTTIPFQFAEKKRKILIKAERLYLIECCNGLIYESEVGSDTAWKQISNSTISDSSSQVYLSYNKGSIYIFKGSIYKFNLSDKLLNKL